MSAAARAFFGLFIGVLCVIGLSLILDNAIQNDKAKAEVIAELPGMTVVGRVSTGPNTTLYLREFDHPTRSKTCLYAVGSGHLAGLTCWDKE